MHDWQAFVRRQLQVNGVRPGREARLVSEVAAQLEDLYRDAILRGVADEEAERLACEHIRDWGRLAADLASVNRVERGPALDRRLESATAGRSGFRRLWVCLASSRQYVRHAARVLMRRR